MNHEKLKAAFLQGGEHEASEVFNELIRGSVREAFWQMMAEEAKCCADRIIGPTKAANTGAPAPRAAASIWAATKRRFVVRGVLARSLEDSASTPGSSLRSEPSVPTESTSEIPT